ncbi:MAG TPA: SAF domain-containing protein [Nocardioidaceae bacterium]|nr:SAF domain-containing protein [Nocardioidaceae bacterium]
MNAARHPHLSAGTPAGAGAAVLSREGHPVPESPPARRLTRASWRDPRLVVGLVLVAVSVLLGARLLAGADDTVTVWSAAGDLSEGSVVEPKDLETSQVRFTSDDLAARYLSAADRPDGMVLLRDVADGELLPRAALGSGAGQDLAELPIALASDAVPAGLRTGELVDVWVTPPTEGDDERRAVRVLQLVRVVAVPQHASALGPASTRQVVVGVPGEEDDLLARALGQLSEGAAVIVRRG